MGRRRILTIKEYDKDKNIEVLATRAGNQGVYTVESFVGDAHYFFENNEVVISTSHGYIRTSLDKAETLAKELVELIPEIRRDRRDGRTPMDSRSIGKMLEGDFK